jgi:hypothetical protein
MSISEEPVTLTVGRAEALVLFEMLAGCPTVPTSTNLRVPHSSHVLCAKGGKANAWS